MTPADGERPRPPRKPARRRTDPVRDAAAEAEAAGNGGDRSGWVDYDAPAESWDPWDEGDAGHEGPGLNRSLLEWLEAVIPPEAQVHFLNAGREFAAGIQVTVEYHARRGQGDDGGSPGPLRIEIE